jgi:Tfp pilus assembly protein PilZ
LVRIAVDDGAQLGRVRRVRRAGDELVLLHFVEGVEVPGQVVSVEVARLAHQAEGVRIDVPEGEAAQHA